MEEEPPGGATLRARCARVENAFRDLHRDLSDFSGLGATRPARIRSRAPAPIGKIDSATRPKRATRDSATRPKIAKNERLGGSAAQPTDAASGWRSHAAVPQHSGLFPGGAGLSGPDPATKWLVIIPLAVVAAPLHTPWGHHYWAKL